MTSIIAQENNSARKDGEPYQAQTDMIGLDVMIERRGGKLVPVVIEVNDHDAGGQYNLDQMSPEISGSTPAPGSPRCSSALAATR